MSLITRELDENMAIAIVDYLQAQLGHPLPDQGFLAGQSVASAILNLWGKEGISGPVNDIDIFAYEYDTNNKLGEYWKGYFDNLKWDEDHSIQKSQTLFIEYSVQTNLRNVSRTYKEEKFNLTMLSYQTDLYRLIGEFDLNITSVGIDLSGENPKLVFTDAFKKFIETGELDYVKCDTPRVVVRIAKKEQAMPWMKVDWPRLGRRAFFTGLFQSTKGTVHLHNLDGEFSKYPVLNDFPRNDDFSKLCKIDIQEQKGGIFSSSNSNHENELHYEVTAPQLNDIGSVCSVDGTLHNPLGIPSHKEIKEYFEAIKNYDAPVIEKYLEIGFPVNLQFGRSGDYSVSYLINEQPNEFMVKSFVDNFELYRKFSSGYEKLPSMHLCITAASKSNVQGIWKDVNQFEKFELQNIYGNQPIHIASYTYDGKNEDALFECIDTCQDINALSAKGETGLSLLLYCQSRQLPPLHIFEKFISSGADLNKGNREGHSNLYQLMALDYSLDFVKMAVANGARFNDEDLKKSLFVELNNRPMWTDTGLFLEKMAYLQEHIPESGKCSKAYSSHIDEFFQRLNSKDKEIGISKNSFGSKQLTESLFCAPGSRLGDYAFEEMTGLGIAITRFSEKVAEILLDAGVVRAFEDKDPESNLKSQHRERVLDDLLRIANSEDFIHATELHFKKTLWMIASGMIDEYSNQEKIKELKKLIHKKADEYQNLNNKAVGKSLAMVSRTAQNARNIAGILNLERHHAWAIWGKIAPLIHLSQEGVNIFKPDSKGRTVFDFVNMSNLDAPERIEMNDRLQSLQSSVKAQNILDDLMLEFSPRIAPGM